jgi:AcrR family transcriptional regulator
MTLGPGMARTATRRADGSAADRLIEAAEQLFGRYGLEGVSLRRISVEAGHGNNNAVQYHFGDAGGLIRAILQKRTPELELRRAELLAEAKAQDRLGSSRALMEILYRPLFEHLDARGERSCARFILALNTSPAGLQHSIDVFHLMAISDHVLDLLHQANPEVPPRLIRERQRLAAVMVLTSLFSRAPPYGDARFDAALIDNALDMATAAVTAPFGPAVGEMLEQTDCPKVPRAPPRSA